MVLLAMGLNGSGYLGWQLRLSDDMAVVTKARTSLSSQGAHSQARQLGQ